MEQTPCHEILEKKTTRYDRSADLGAVNTRRRNDVPAGFSGTTVQSQTAALSVLGLAGVSMGARFSLPLGSTAVASSARCLTCVVRLALQTASSAIPTTRMARAALRCTRGCASFDHARAVGAPLISIGSIKSGVDLRDGPRSVASNYIILEVSTSKHVVLFGVVLTALFSGAVLRLCDGRVDRRLCRPLPAASALTSACRRCRTRRLGRRAAQSTRLPQGSAAAAERIAASSQASSRPPSLPPPLLPPPSPNMC